VGQQVGPWALQAYGTCRADVQSSASRLLLLLLPLLRLLLLLPLLRLLLPLLLLGLWGWACSPAWALLLVLFVLLRCMWELSWLLLLMMMRGYNEFICI
jgi:hypothetical protein